MKDSIVDIGTKLRIPACVIFITYCLFYQYIVFSPYLIIAKVILLLLAIILAMTWIIEMFSSVKKKSKPRLSDKSMVKILYSYSRQIITLSFSCYFAVYLIFFLDRKSIFYNYLVLLLFGLYLGYEVAVRASFYKKDNKSEE